MPTTLPAYTVFNLGASYELFDAFKLSARVENMTDEQYITAANGYAKNGDLLGYVPLGRQLYISGTFNF